MQMLPRHVIYQLDSNWPSVRPHERSLEYAVRVRLVCLADCQSISVSPIPVDLISQAGGSPGI